MSLGRVNFDLQSDNDSVNDVASVYSNGSYDDESNGDNQLVTEKYEEKLLQSIENATEKSTQVRIQALQHIAEILQHRYIPDFVDDRRMTLIDIVEKSLRRGKGLEQEWAARLLTPLLIQLGGDSEIPATLCQILSTSIQGRDCPFSVRAWFCTALAMLQFLNSNDIGDVIEVMQQFEQIFSNSYLKGDKTSPTVSDDAAQLHTAALSAWGLLATLVPPRDFCAYVTNGTILP